MDVRNKGNQKWRGSRCKGLEVGHACWSELVQSGQSD